MANRPKTCKVCGCGEEEVGHISWRGNCAVHGKARLNANNEAMSTGEGEFRLHWARRSLMAARRSLIAAERNAA